jgi:hypothetical protein
VDYAAAVEGFAEIAKMLPVDSSFSGRTGGK